MLSRLGLRVLAADLDPQANLTAYFCPITDIEALWSEPERPVHISNCLAPLFRAVQPSPVPTPVLWDIARQPSLFGMQLALVPGNLELGRYEDSLATAWLQIRSDSPGPYIGQTLSFWNVLKRAADVYQPDVTLVDVGPNLGAITRAALLATDLVIVPLAADVFSIQGLRNLGPTLERWRQTWQSVRERALEAGVTDELPTGDMAPAGYVILQHAVRKNRPVKAYQTWLEQIPLDYQRSILGASTGGAPKDASQDPHCIGQVRHYQSLVPLSQDANKPMFDLKAGDGAIGGHQNYVAECYENFEQLAAALAERCGLPIPQTAQDSGRPVTPSLHHQRPLQRLS